MGLLDRINERAIRAPETRSSIDQWVSEYLLPSQSQFVHNGMIYPVGFSQSMGLPQTLIGERATEYSATLPGHAQALRSCPPAFSAQLVRALVLSQARFTFRRRSSAGPNRGRTFGTRDLSILENPWPNGTTGDLLGRMEWHAGLGGNAFVLRQGNRLRVLRPDWVAVVFGSEMEPSDASGALDSRVLGYVYQNGGFLSEHRPEVLAPADVAHWYPLPDPENNGIGMSWVTPAIREIRGDNSATMHKLKYFENGATPNMVVKGIPATTQEQFDSYVDMMETNHTGIRNAYRTLYLVQGVDATVVGNSMTQIDFSSVLATGETRLSVLSRVPAALLGISEGLKGAALNSGNFGMARRIFGDTWVYPTLQNLSASLAPLVNVPSDAELWFDVVDIPLLREDAADAASICQVQAATIVALVNAGFDPAQVVPAVTARDLGALATAHSGMLSVQLQPPGAEVQPPAGTQQGTGNA